MIPYTRYFNEGFTPPSGIDTISIWIHPLIINRLDAFHQRGNNNEPVTLRVKQEKDNRTGNFIRTNCLLDIQAEALDPEQDILRQVLRYLLSMERCGILKQHQNCDDNGILNYFNVDFSELFAIDALDFYFDFFDGDIVLIGTNPQYPNTRYSSRSIAHPSILKAYGRPERLRQKRHIPYETIRNMNYPKRIEFSLRRGNCNYLHSHNLSGNYHDVFYRYLPFLARKWHDYRHETVDIPDRRNLDYNPCFQQILCMARSRIPQYRNLLETPRKAIPFKHAKRNETDRNWSAWFYANT
jgi:hypothetical protein